MNLSLKQRVQLWLAILFCTPFTLSAQFFGDFQTAQNCELTLQLKDDVGNGWGDGYIYVKVNGAPKGIYTAISTNNTYRLSVPNGANVELTYDGGSQNADNSYQILNAEGVEIFADGPQYTNGVAQASRLLNFSVVCPSTCSGLNAYTMNLKLGQNPSQIGWELWTTDGERLAFAQPNSYNGFTAGMEVNIPLNIANCAGVYFKILGGAAAWNSGSVAIYSDDIKRGIIQNNGAFQGKGLVYETVDFSVSETDIFSFPCVTCPDDLVVTSADSATCSVSNFTFPASHLPEPIICYPDYNGQNGVAPITLVSFPSLGIANQKVDTTFNLPVGKWETVFETTFADGQKLRCTSNTIVVPDTQPRVNCHPSLTVVLGDGDADCTVTVLPSTVLPGDVCDESYTVSLEINGNPLPSNTLDGSYVGQTIFYRLTALATSATCTGSFTVEDQGDPIVMPNNYNLPCNHPDPLNEDYANSDTLEAQVQYPFNMTGFGATNVAFEAGCFKLGEVIKDVRINLLIDHRAASELGRFTLTSPTGQSFPMQKQVVSNRLVELSLESDLINASNAQSMLGQPADSMEGVWKFLIFDERDNFNKGSLLSASLIIETGFDNFSELSDCGSIQTRVVSERIESRLCTGEIGGTLVRVWESTDGSGNKSIGEQEIQFIKPTFDELDLPESIGLSCGMSASPASIGGPTYNCEPVVESDLSLCRMTYTYTDEEIPSCGSSKIITRKWNIVNWCANATLTHYQSIHIIDDTAPIVLNTQVSTNSNIYTCDGTVNIASIVQDDCSGLEQVSATYFFKEAGIAGYYKTVDITDGTPLEGLQMGLNTIRLLSTDSCGNIGRDTVSIVVEDNIPPTPLCDGLTISLGPNGQGRVNASDLDAGSYDNCEVQRIELKRLDSGCQDEEPFGPFISLACCDVGQTIDVEMRVVDNAGNSNSCIVEVKVEDKYLPYIECPADTVINCESFVGIENLSVFGSPVVQDNCSATFNEEVQDNRTDCGDGEIIRFFSASDAFGNEVSCYQKITLISTSYIEVRFPNDTLIESCATNLDGIKEPELLSNGCIQVGISYTDEAFEGPNVNGCSAIKRKWKIYNWCGYDEDVEELNNTGIRLGDRHFRDDGDGYFEFTQLITFGNSNKPTFLGDEVEQEVSVTCDQNYVFPTINALTYCGDTIAVSPSIISKQIEVGEEVEVLYRVTDNCGNIASRTIVYRFVDKRSPTPVCFTNNNFTIGKDNAVKIHARDLTNNTLTSDGCANTTGLMYSYSEDIADSTRIFTCEDIGLSEFEVYVTDESGNVGMCTASLDIVGNGRCGLFSIAGRVETVQGRAVQNAKVLIGPELELDIKTDDGGYFEIMDLETERDYELTAAVDASITEGISVFDLLLLQRHLLGIDPFTEKHQFISADIDNSSYLSIVDLSNIQQVLLDKRQVFSQNPSWKVVNKESLMGAGSWESTESGINVTNFNSPISDADFVAIKMGDLNQSFGNTTVQSRSELPLQYEVLESNGVREVLVYCDGSEELGAIHLDLRFESDFIRLEPGQLRIEEKDFHQEQNRLKIAFAPQNTMKVDSKKPLFSFFIKNNSTLDLIKSEWVNSSLKSYNIKLHRINKEEKDTEVYPNPFVDQLNIVGEVSEISSIELYNDLGQQIFEKSIVDVNNDLININFNNIRILKGVYFLRVNGNASSKVFRIIKN